MPDEAGEKSKGKKTANNKCHAPQLLFQLITQYIVEMPHLHISVLRLGVSKVKIPYCNTKVLFPLDLATIMSQKMF